MMTLNMGIRLARDEDVCLSIMEDARILSQAYNGSKAGAVRCLASIIEDKVRKNPELMDFLIKLALEDIGWEQIASGFLEEI